MSDLRNLVHCGSFDNDTELELCCHDQIRHLKKGEVMQDGYVWIAEKDYKGDKDDLWLEEMPDFVHVHTSKECMKNYALAYPDSYKKHIAWEAKK